MTGIVFEIAHENNQLKYCTGRTLKLRVITRLGLGLILAPTILSGTNIILNSESIIVLDPTVDTGSFELEFECIDGININYLGKKESLSVTSNNESIRYYTSSIR